MLVNRAARPCFMQEIATQKNPKSLTEADGQRAITQQTATS
jgi:hypothetical protein